MSIRSSWEPVDWHPRARYAESYQLLGASADQAAELLRNASLAGFVTPSGTRWMSIYPEGRPLTENSALLAANPGLMVQVVHFQEQFWLFKAFFKETRVARLIVKNTGEVFLRTRTDPDGLAQILKGFPIEARQLDSVFRRLVGAAPPAEYDPAIMPRILQWFGMQPDGLSFDQLADVNARGAGLPNGVVAIDSNTLPSRLQRAGESQFDAACLLFPLECYGTEEDVRARMATLGRQFLAAQEPHLLLEKLPCIPFRELGKEILMSRSESHFAPTAPAWRLYAVIDAFLFGFQRLKLFEDLRQPALRESLVAGLKNFWFAAAMLADSDVSRVRMFRDARRRQLLELLRGYVEWLPELHALDAALKSHDVKTYRMLQNAPGWAENIVAIAVAAGWSISAKQLAGVYAGDWMKALEATRVIEAQGGRYQIHPAFASGS